MHSNLRVYIYKIIYHSVPGVNDFGQTDDKLESFYDLTNILRANELRWAVARESFGAWFLFQKALSGLHLTLKRIDSSDVVKQNAVLTFFADDIIWPSVIDGTKSFRHMRPYILYLTIRKSLRGPTLTIEYVYSSFV